VEMSDFQEPSFRKKKVKKIKKKNKGMELEDIQEVLFLAMILII
jgi:hypothetical protein